MREMLARTQNDFMTTNARRTRRSAGKPVRAAMLRPLFRNPGRTALGAAGAAVVVGILVNALVLQGGPHPAPFFRPAPEAVKAAPEAARTAPLPPQRPLAAGEEASSTASAGSAPRAAKPAAVVATPAPLPPAAPANRDAIGEMLRAGQAGPAADKSVLAAQRALAKLNYGPVKPDGVFGAGTRQALEKFERDHRLPVTGELNPRTARELSAASGIQVD